MGLIPALPWDSRFRPPVAKDLFFLYLPSKTTPGGRFLKGLEKDQGGVLEPYHSPPRTEHRSPLPWDVSQELPLLGEFCLRPSSRPGGPLFLYHPSVAPSHTSAFSDLLSTCRLHSVLVSRTLIRHGISVMKVFILWKRVRHFILPMPD